MKPVIILIFILCGIFILNFDNFVNAQTDEAIEEYCIDNWKKSPSLCSEYVPENYNEKNAHDVIAEKELQNNQERIKQMRELVCPPETEKQIRGLDAFCMSKSDIQKSNTNSDLRDVPPIVFIGFALMMIIIMIIVIKKAVGSDNNPNNSYNIHSNGFENSRVPVKSNKNFSNNTSKKSRPAMPAYLRHKVLQRDHIRCTDCGATKDEISLHIDHILPWSKGGTHDFRNLQTLCRTCNLAKMTRRWIGGKK
jgi:5-methylcytosine-specific restriction endonuclease McrA